MFVPLSGAACIYLASANSASVEKLQEVWIRLTELRRRMRRVDRLLEGMRMLGWPIQVDEDSIRLQQPAHMLLACCNPDKLKGAV
jgi:hypothetical protein